MKRPPILLLAACATALASTALTSTASAAPITVTHFVSTEATLVPVKGAVAVTTAPGDDPTSLEARPWLEAVGRELSALGYGAATPGAADFIVEVHADRDTTHHEHHRGPVSVGMGGESGSRYSGFGMGVGFTFGGGPKDTVATRLVVVIRDRASGRPWWEGRAENIETAKKREAGADVAAPRLAHAVFAGFPGKSGETITVK
ncbi:hypothetical protein Y88_2172 [Novosphingobium nitrogenifigens DSM 19370]|uniref:DUF4136 domain-containing protein n=1 Tax=Novosphingobium nitrogenifigens DSM 19370 TaxID=983920 RepID=F1Z5C0_9SPHN|nr:DUF4136 domain-containing protein [Novosphingobium nitrogenifigens]EGD60298.1 hypothetical protein Y88_2172 [Novosphingobium nitrogenifigens DSM 19370]